MMTGLVLALRQFGITRIVLLAGIAALALGYVSYFSARIFAPPMALLFGDLEPSESAALVTRLEGMNVAYSLRNDGREILVPAERVSSLRLGFAGEGLPASENSGGYALFDKSSFGISNFVQNVNYIRALEGELARTLRGLDGVSSARVHLSLPGREIFGRNRRQGSASVVLRVGSRGLGASQAIAIQNLVAAAVAGVSTGQVSIVDEKGNLLLPARGDGSDALASASRINEIRISEEERIASALERMLERHVGPGRARVEVALEISFDRASSREEQVDPEAVALLSARTVSEENTATGPDGGVVSVRSNLPDTETETGGTDAGSRSNRTDETRNFAISRVTRDMVREAGSIGRRSVAVMVDGTTTTDADGNTAWQPRTEEELASLKTLVEGAIGHDETRGDRVEVVSLRFVEPPALPEPEPEFSFHGFGKYDLLRLVEVIVFAALSMMFLFLLLRPILGRLLQEPRLSQMELERRGLAYNEQGELVSLPPPPPPEPEYVPPPPSELDTAIEMARVEGRVSNEAMGKITSLVSANPEGAANVVRLWLGEMEGASAG